ncbi:hypothetical protein HELA111659_03180 [Helicobacter labetoulli]
MITPLIKMERVLKKIKEYAPVVITLIKDLKSLFSSDKKI